MFFGKKIKLCAISEKHTDYFYKMFNDMEIQRNADVVKNPTSREQVRSFIEKSQETSEYSYWFVIEDYEGHSVGDVDINDPDIRNGKFRYGISILQEYRGKGYAKEAILLVLNYYFNELRFNKANAEVHEFNSKSIKLHESLGFSWEGKIRESLYVNGKYCDEYLFGITKKEFNNRYLDEITNILKAEKNV